MSTGPVAGGITPELVAIVVIAMVLVPLQLLLSVKVLKGEFWPGHLLDEYRAGRSEALSDDETDLK
ncbi:MAG: hypothetical protein ACOCYZ_00990 [Halococcoides sp.]